MKPWLLVFLLNGVAVLFIQTVGAEPSEKTYVLPDIIGFAIERNPVVAGAMAVIDQILVSARQPAPIPIRPSEATAAVGI